MPNAWENKKQTTDGQNPTATDGRSKLGGYSDSLRPKILFRREPSHSKSDKTLEKTRKLLVFYPAATKSTSGLLHKLHNGHAHM